MADETSSIQQTQEPAVPEPHVDSVRAAVEAAYDKSEAAGGNASGQSADLAVRPGEAVKPVTPAPASEKVRDPKTGQFVPKEKAAEGLLPAKPAAPTVAAPAKPAAAPAPAAAGTPVKPGEEVEDPNAKMVDRAPQSWRPAAKAEWAKLPPPVKAEALRLEREREAVLRDSAGARQEVEEWDGTVAPYRQFIQAAGHTPRESVAALMQTAATLQAGTEWDRAALVASIIRAHNVNPELVGAALADPSAVQGYAQPQQPQPGQFRDPRVDELFAGIRQQREALSSQADAQADSELDEFIASHPLAGDVDVQRRMARAMDLAGEDGVDMSFDEAYAGVLAVDAELRSIAEQQALVAAPTPDGATARAEAAALSVRPSPVAAAPAPTLKGKGVEAHVRAAYEKMEAGRR